MNLEVINHTVKINSRSSFLIESVTIAFEKDQYLAIFICLKYYFTLVHLSDDTTPNYSAAFA